MIKYLIGNAVYPTEVQELHPDKKIIIAHVCNCQNGWGKGFVLSLSGRWKLPEQKYRSLNHSEELLGRTQFVEVEPNIIVANMIAQKGYRKNNSAPHKINGVDNTEIPLQPWALEICLKRVFYRAKHDFDDAIIVSIRLGCGLGASTWDQIEPIINKSMLDSSIMYVYDLF
jgi:hypothetical protein